MVVARLRVMCSAWPRPKTCVSVRARATVRFWVRCLVLGLGLELRL